MTAFQMVISILGVVISLLTLCGIGVVMKHYWDDKHEEKKANKEEEKAKAKRERQEEIREVFSVEMKKEITPVHDELKGMSQSLKGIDSTIRLLKESVIALDRIVMKMNLDLYKDHGYVNSSDRAAWNELFHNYSNLGGNHFKEYVDEWRRILEGLPTKEEVQAEHANNITNQ